MGQLRYLSHFLYRTLTELVDNNQDFGAQVGGFSPVEDGFIYLAAANSHEGMTMHLECSAYFFRFIVSRSSQYCSSVSCGPYALLSFMFRFWERAEAIGTFQVTWLTDTGENGVADADLQTWHEAPPHNRVYFLD